MVEGMNLSFFRFHISRPKSADPPGSDHHSLRDGHMIRPIWDPACRVVKILPFRQFPETAIPQSGLLIPSKENGTRFEVVLVIMDGFSCFITVAHTWRGRQQAHQGVNPLARAPGRKKITLCERCEAQGSAGADDAQCLAGVDGYRWGGREPSDIGMV
jgi:hypothetical protein